MESLQRPLRVYEGTAVERHTEAAPAFQLDAARSVRLHPKLAVCVACMVLVLTVGYALTRKPMYEARSLSYVEPLETKVVSDGTPGIYDPARYDSYFQQQIQTATRQDILEAAVRKLPEGVWQMPGEDVHHAAERLAGALKVERVGSSYQLAISVRSDDSEKASAIVNAVTNSYLEQGRKDENARSDGRLVLLQEERQRIQKELEQDREEQATLGQTLGVADTQSDGLNPYDLQLAGVRTELIAARQAHDVAAAQLASVSGRGSSSAGLTAIADEAIAADTGLSALKTTINERRAVLNAQMATLTPSNPVYKQDADEIASMEKQVEARMGQLRQTAERRLEDKLRLDLQRTGDVESRLNGQLAHATALAGTAAPKLQRAKDLAADITRLQARFATVDDALRGLQLESSGPGTAHLLVAARVPDSPAANYRMLLLLLALPLAMFAGIVAAVLARKFDRRLRSPIDLEQAVGVAPMSVMPASFSYYDAAHDEHLLRLATALERGQRLNGARMFVFTAASQSMDTSGLIHGVLSKLSNLGFKAVALAAADLRHTTAAERKLGKGSSQLERLKGENTFVLIDAPPLLHSADAEYAVSSADATMIVAEGGLTTAVELKQCMVLLQRLKATGVGTILVNVADAAGETQLRRHTEVVERQKTPVWERTRDKTPQQMSAVPRWQDDNATTSNTPTPMIDDIEDAPLPKRVQLVPFAAEHARSAPAQYGSEPEIRFEEAVVAAPAPAPVQRVQEVVTEREPAVVVRKFVQPAPVQRPPASQGYEAPEKIEQPVVAKMAEPVVPGKGDEKAERAKREAIARVKARFGVPVGVAEAISEAMQKPMPKLEPDFAPMVAFRAGKTSSSAAKKIVAEQAAQVAVPQELVKDVEYEWQAPPQPVFEVPVAKPVNEAPVRPVTIPRPAPAQVLRPVVSTAYEDLPPVRRVTLQPERAQPTTMPLQWALQPERRRVPREPILFPSGLNKAALRMSEKGQVIAKGHAGPSLTAAEQAVANKISSAHQPVAAAPPPRRAQSAEQIEDQDGRWNLLRKFGAFEIEGLGESGLEERAAG